MAIEKMEQLMNKEEAIKKDLVPFSQKRLPFSIVMLKRIEELSTAGVNFAFETTLASRIFAPKIQVLKKQGYQFHLIFLWLNSPEIAILRVRERIKMGGHSVSQKRQFSVDTIQGLIISLICTDL